MALKRSTIDKALHLTPRSVPSFTRIPITATVTVCACRSFALSPARSTFSHRAQNTAADSLRSSASSWSARQAFAKSRQLRLTHFNSYSTVVVHNKGQARVRRTISFLLISSLSFAVGAYLAINYSSPILHPLIMGSIPSDAETLSLYAPDNDFSREIDEHIKNSTLARSLRSNPDFIESRPHLKIPAEVKQHNLTAGTLSGPGMIVVPPYYFNEKDGKSMVQIFYVGADVSGHPGIVHGGFLATMLDEGLARCAFPAMANKVGVTANLNINYLKPTMAGQFLVLRATTTKVDGRKAWAEGWIESFEVAEGEEPIKLVEASALFIEPKHAKALKSLYRVAA